MSKKYTTDNITIDGILNDGAGAGTSGQVLSSTATGVSWIEGSAIPGGVSGTGTANYVPVWTSGSAIGNSPFVVNGSQLDIPEYIRHIGDTNTYFGFPGGSDTIIFGTNASERMRVDSSGNVGIGTTSPNANLHIKSGSAGTYTPSTLADELLLESANSGGVTLLTPSAFNSSIIFGSPDRQIGSRITWNYDSLLMNVGTATANANLAFKAGNDSEVMRIDSSGNVGIGTTNPQQRLDVNTNSTGLNIDNTAAIFGNDVGTTQSRDAWIKMRASSQTNDRTWAFGSQQSGDFRFNYLGTRATSPTSGSTFLTIKNTGNVGIGTTSPSQKLEVNGNALLTSGRIYLGNTSHYIAEISGDLYSVTSGKNIFYSGSAERMRINSGGNVSIGNTNNTYKLDVTGTGRLTGALTAASGTFSGNINAGSGLGAVSTDGILSINGGSASGGEAYLRLSRGGVAGFILNHTATAIQVRATANIPMFFYTNDTIGIKLNANSTVSFPEYAAGYLKTDASGNITADNTGGGLPGGPYLPLTGGTLSGDLTISKTATPLFKLLDTTNNISLLLGADDANTFIRSSTGANIYFQPASSTSLTLLSGGNVGIGTTSPNEKLQVGGNINIHDEVGNTDASLFISQGSTNATTVILASNGDSYLNGGNVGIGTTSPGAKLEIAGDMLYLNSTTQPRLKFNSGGAAINNRLWDFIPQSSGTFIGRVLNDAETSATTWINVVRSGNTISNITLPAGNVGIGTTSPATKLHIKDIGKLALITIESDTVYSSGIEFTDSNGSRGSISMSSADMFSINTGGGTKLRLTSAGDMALGTNNSAPTQQLHLDANIRVEGAYYDSLNSPGSNGQVLSSTGNGTTTDWITPASGGTIGGTATSTQVAYGSGTNTITSQSDFDFVTAVANEKRLRLQNSVIQTGTISATASASLVGSLRYRTFVPQIGRTQSTVEMCVQTGASTYVWTALYTSSTW